MEGHPEPFFKSNYDKKPPETAPLTAPKLKNPVII
jgi:hypothetical protein